METLLHKKRRILLIIVILLVPIAMYLLFARMATLGEWLSFFGSYIGSVITVAFAYFNTLYETKKQSENIKLQLEQSKQNDLDNEIRKTKIKNLAYLVNASVVLLVDVRNTEHELVINANNIKKYEDLCIEETVNLKSSVQAYFDIYNRHLAFFDEEEGNELSKINHKLAELFDQYYKENKDKVVEISKKTGILSVQDQAFFKKFHEDMYVYIEDECSYLVSAYNFYYKKAKKVN